MEWKVESLDAIKIRGNVKTFRFFNGIICNNNKIRIIHVIIIIIIIKFGIICWYFR